MPIILYKKSKKGDKLQQWSIEVQGDSYRTIEGFKGGKLTTGAWTKAEPKNVGRSNETTPEQQAIIEAAAKTQKKKDKGYSEDPDNCERPFEPTLAKVWEDHAKKVQWPVWVTPKLDGMRCLVLEDGSMISRERKPVVSCPHISRAIVDFMGLGGTVWDGELYNHELLKNDFNRLISLVKQQKPTAEDLAASEKDIEFHIFDYVDAGKHSYRARMMNLEIFFGHSRTPKCIKLVLPKIAHNLAELKVIAQEFIDEGYEGAMVRWTDDLGYIIGRTDKLLKYKLFIDAEFEVVRVEEGKGKDAGMVSKWVVKDDKGIISEAGATGTEAENRLLWQQYLADPSILIGKMATIKFQGYTKDGRLRFGTFKCIRD